MNDLKSENEKPKTKMKDLYEYQTDSEFVENKLLELEDLSKRFNLRTHQVIEAWYGTWEKCEKHLETLFEYKLGKEENITIKRARRTNLSPKCRRGKPKLYSLSSIITKIKLRSCKMQRNQRGPASLLTKILVRKTFHIG